MKHRARGLILILSIASCGSPAGEGYSPFPWIDVPALDLGARLRDAGIGRGDGGGALNGDGGADAGAVSGDGGGDAGPSCGVGGVAGKACAPDQTTAVNGAQVAIDATDCNGNSAHFETTSDAQGRWTITGIPAGEAQLTITIGSFVQRETVRVTAGVTTQLVAGKTCFNPATVKIAVVSGAGDKIEDLLTSLGFAPDVINGKPTSSRPTPPAAAFLGDIARLRQYQILFIDCAAFTRNGRVDLGASASTIIQNLRAFVDGGGSIYGSDWAGPILAMAYPASVVLRLASGSTTALTLAASPFTTNNLVGYAPQQIAATVANASLASYIGSASVSITFPTSPASNHWAMMTSPVATGISADITGDAVMCDAGDCTRRGATATATPLAISFRPDPLRTHGGNVIFTSFHNIAQPTSDVKKILEHLIFRL